MGELIAIRALAAGRCSAAACVSEPRFAPAVCGAVAAVAVMPSAVAAADEPFIVKIPMSGRATASMRASG